MVIKINHVASKPETVMLLIILSNFLSIIFNLFLCHHLLFLSYSLNFNCVNDDDTVIYIAAVLFHMII